MVLCGGVEPRWLEHPACRQTTKRGGGDGPQARRAAADDDPEGVYGVLRAAILDGTVPPGGQLRERDIAADLGVSRSPLREALTRLEEEGLIVKIPFRGAFVVEVSAQDIAEIASIRLLVDPYAGELALDALRGCRAGQVDPDDRGLSSGDGEERHPGQHRRTPSVPQALLRAVGTLGSAQPLERLGDQAAPVPHGRPSLLQRATRHRCRTREAGCSRPGGRRGGVPTGAGTPFPVSAASRDRGPRERARRARLSAGRRLLTGAP